jgi:hypothetical protein
MSRLRDLTRHVAAPARDLLGGLDRLLAAKGRSPARTLIAVFAGLAVGWWIYVPIHELLHVAGCLIAGGRVERLDLDPIYGADLLARVFPFVHSGSEYAGRLSGFDTRGSDAIYLATDLAPFVLALLPGLWAVRRAARSGLGFFFGAALPAAYSPWLSATGDAYEIGSLAVTNLPAWAAERARLLGDDLFARASALAAAEGAPWAGFLLAAVLGILWAALTTALGSWIATRFGEPELSTREPERTAR